MTEQNSNANQIEIAGKPTRGDIWLVALMFSAPVAALLAGDVVYAMSRISPFTVRAILFPILFILSWVILAWVASRSQSRGFAFSVTCFEYLGAAFIFLIASSIVRSTADITRADAFVYAAMLVHDLVMLATGAIALLLGLISFFISAGGIKGGTKGGINEFRNAGGPAPGLRNYQMDKARKLVGGSTRLPPFDG